MYVTDVRHNAIFGFLACSRHKGLLRLNWWVRIPLEGFLGRWLRIRGLFFSLRTSWSPNGFEFYRGKIYNFFFNITISKPISKFKNGICSSHFTYLLIPLDRIGFGWNLGFHKAQTESFTTAQKSSKSDTICWGKRPAQRRAQFQIEKAFFVQIILAPKYLLFFVCVAKLHIFPWENCLVVLKMSGRVVPILVFTWALGF